MLSGYEDHRPLMGAVEHAGFRPHTDRHGYKTFGPGGWVARLSLARTVMSKRRRRLGRGYVSGWDDPRMPT